MYLHESQVWKDTFFNNDFDIDQCLTTLTQKSELETLKRNLQKYGDVLHSQMAEILKTETEAIVNLAEYLTNLNTKIECLNAPISQLQAEIKTLYELVKTAQSYYKITLDKISENNRTKIHKTLKLELYSAALYADSLIERKNFTDDITMLERAVSKYSFQKTYLTESGTHDIDVEVLNVEDKLIDIINFKFLNAVQEKNLVLTEQCLKMYNDLEKPKEAEMSYRVNIVRPTLKKWVNEQYLDKNDQDINKIYDAALEFLSSEVTILVTIVQNDASLKGFDFILNSFWVELDTQLREHLPHITAPGNPEQFQNRFKNTWELLLAISDKCGDQNKIKTDPTFQEHIKRFNLPVYFEITFQQIAGQLEADLVVQKPIFVNNGDLKCKLKVTATLFSCLMACFNENIFIDHLSDQFLKLALLLVSRYVTWFYKGLENHKLLSESQDWENFIITSLHDFDVLKLQMAPHCNGDLLQVISKVVPLKIRVYVSKVFELNTKVLTQATEKLSDHLIALKVNDSISELQNVGAIPRLYRRTNRNAPVSGSPYIAKAVAPITNFVTKFMNYKELTAPILDCIISSISKHYLTLVQDVLHSVDKTEESLRRLKNRNFNPSEDNTSQNSATITDEMKIRKQIQLDVQYFIEKLSPHASETSLKELDVLRALIN